MTHIEGHKKIHLIGIGGCSMNGLAQILRARGYQVQGSDSTTSPFTERLGELGIPVAIGQKAENIGDADLVVYSAAIKPDNPERAEARRRGIPELERSVALGQPDDTRFYLRYYYSAQFLASAHELHHRNYQQLQARLSRYFVSSHDSWLLMAHIFETILSFVSHVLCGDLQDTPELDEQVFNLIFRTLQPYMLP